MTPVRPIVRNLQATAGRVCGTVDAIVGLAADGHPLSEILDAYPFLKASDIPRASDEGSGTAGD